MVKKLTKDELDEIFTNMSPTPPARKTQLKEPKHNDPYKHLRKKGPGYIVYPPRNNAV